MKKRIMIIGPTGSGKTTLCHKINGYDGPLRKTQDMIFGTHTIDVPGSYLENPWMYKHLIAAAQNGASQIVLIVDAVGKREDYSHGFAKVFSCPVIGVITKCGPEDECAKKCEEQLKKAGVEKPWFYISSKDDEVGIEKLKNYLFSLMLDGGKNEIYNRKRSSCSVS